MVQLADADIKTKEVLDWKGLHVFHFPYSSCSQKLRIFLKLKGVQWESHVVDLMTNENLSEWFLGINPRGLVPVLVDDGAVHIESNDILTYLEAKFGAPRLIPAETAAELASLLRHEDELHLDLRALSFRFVFAPPGPPKSPEELKTYASAGSGTVAGQKDERVGVEIDFWERLSTEGITDDVAKTAASKFRTAFAELEKRLGANPYLLGASLSILDIAWFIYANRLMLAGYPFHRLHPKLGAWYDGLSARPEFAGEVALPPPVEQKFAETRAQHAAKGQSLEQVAGL